MRPLLSESSVDPKARASMERFGQGIVAQVRDAIAKHRVVVVGMGINPHVKRARAALTAAGIGFEYLEFGSYFAGWQDRLAIKLWSGWPTFPQVFVGGTLIGGADECQAAIADGRITAG